MIDDATAVRCFLSIWAEPTDDEVDFWLMALQPLGNNLQNGLMRAVRICKDKPLPREVMAANGFGPVGSTIREVVSAIAEQYGLTVQDICGPSKAHGVSHPRQHIMNELIQMGFSTTRIGRFLNRDHSTVVYGAAAHRERMARWQSLSVGVLR